ncbi:hypothetical protein [Thalassolituus pacificus]|uniref:Uncharacterized protein n=1 Tax=Thalassolituus pacificus TaxID=2975440 RepID=A0A9X3AGS6_9GAMM|nr:hypothetical protein [Thalassolituus pacificus]MCT7359447.1 hypothetical protein [Thalassolituus pacificus]
MNQEIKEALRDLVPIVLKELAYIAVLLCVAAFVFENVDFKLYSSVLQGLQVLASVVFAIVGLWIGSIYPTAITSIANDDVSYIIGTKDGESVERLVNTIMISAFVMLSTLAVYVIKMTLIGTGFYVNNIVWVKYLAVFYLYYICLLQVRCILTVISAEFIY